MIRLEKLTWDNYDDVLKLKVGFVEKPELYEDLGEMPAVLKL